ncbi:MAG TPA: NAD(P)H-hydrate dehydratase [Chitinophagaceae bacterium]|nr:NAD(P)H-hydrate dehydratase [Chitinophagaceae bacterium]
MKILSAAEIREWDQYTIQQEPIASIDLMERAAARCTEWLIQQYPDASSFGIFCGKGNNGGDGLAMARMLIEKAYPVSIHILEFGHKGTEDFQVNLARLNKLPDHDIYFVQSTQNFHSFPSGQIIVDALLGSGLNRPLEGVTAGLVEHMNTSGCDIVSIDIPSGLFADASSNNSLTIHATHTLSFQCYKPAFLFAENSDAIGQVHLLNIGLDTRYLLQLSSRFELVNDEVIRSIYKPRKRFAHKGIFGHALLVAGSYGKIGAAILAARSCMRSGVGLLTCHIPGCGYDILQSTLPEAMVTTDFNSSFNSKIDGDLSKYDTIGIGPGLGTASETRMMLRETFDAYRSPVVLDADALNIMASQKDLLRYIPPGSILTPHPKEFERLFGSPANDFERAWMALQKAKELNCIIILKGHHCFIATPDQKGFFNSTGNAGMATAGSGDVLTGILTGLLAQGYSSVETAILGTYIHGLAGDLAAKEISQEALLAGDIIEKIGAAYQALSLVHH